MQFKDVKISQTVYHESLDWGPGQVLDKINTTDQPKALVLFSRGKKVVPTRRLTPNDPFENEAAGPS